MALKVPSGMLFIDGGPKSGAATISFNPLRLAAAPGTVSWAGTGPSFHEEIPFMVIGEVPDPRPIPVPGRPPRRPRRPARRRAARRRKARR